MQAEMNVALIGNPNCGKTTLFNDLTGTNQYTGNWPGVTVEKKEGTYTSDTSTTIIDLPGVYSLSPYTPEELVTREYLLSGNPDVVINIVDASNLERNLYLTTQLMDMHIPMVLALNMMDVVEKSGAKIDEEELSAQLGCPVIGISALKGRGVRELMEAAKRASGASAATQNMRFAPQIETELSHVESIIEGKVNKPFVRWYAIKALEGEEAALGDLSLDDERAHMVDEIRTALETAEGDEAESIIINARYEWITEACDRVMTRAPQKASITEKIDRIVTNRVLGIPIFMVIMTLVYYLSVSTVGTIAIDWANDGLFGDGWLYTNVDVYEGAVIAWEDEVAAATDAGASETFLASLEEAEPNPADYGIWHPGIPVVMSAWLEQIGCAPWVQSLLIDGILGGVGAVLGFVPQLIVLFLLLGFLEGCGYMARVAFIMDRIFRKFGLSGKSFIPMLIASGCGVPAVMATKTIENEKDRRMTVMTTTMIPCGAKLPIIALVFGALAGGFYEQTWWVAPLFYFLGLAAIIVSCIMLKKLKTFAGEAAPFIMELPQYHLPTVKNILLSTWERVRAYLVKAGTIIFLSSMIIWFLLNFGVYEGQFGLLDPEVEDYIQYSLMAGLGNALAWIFVPLGFGNWEGTVTSITGLVAKENIVATVGIITSLGEVGEADPGLWLAFANMMGGASVAIMAFCAFNLLCAPCFAAMGAIRNQMASAKWTMAAIGYMCGFAWVVSLIIYQLGGLVTGEVAFNVWSVVAIVALGLMIFQLLRPMPDYREKKQICAPNALDAEGAGA